MPVGFSSAARNLWLLGASGQQVVTNFFKQMDASNASVINNTPSAIKYSESDEKYITAGYNNVNSGPKVGYLEKVQEDGSKDWNIGITATVPGNEVYLNNLHIDSNDKLLVCGYANNESPFLSRYDSNGVLEWQSTSNSGDVEYKSVTSDSNNVYYACGHTQSIAFVEKFDSAGTPGWGKAAYMLGRYVRLNNISTNGRGEVVAVGSLEDDTRDKGYIVKIDTTTGQVMWDRTLDYRDPSPGNIITDKERADVTITRCYIDGNDNIYITGQINSLKGRMFVAKYSPEGNLLWQKMTTNSIHVSDGFSEYPFGIYADTETEQISVAYSSGSAENSFIYTAKYSKGGKLLWRRRLDKGTNLFDDKLTPPVGDGLDGSPSFYFLLFQDASDPDDYTFGKVSTAGNGLGNFEYDDGTGLPLINYVYITGDDDVGLLSDGSIRNDTSDFIRYPISPNHIVFDDLATPLSNKKRQMDSADSFDYSGSPAIRPADFQELNLLGDVGVSAGPELVQNGTFDSDVSNWTAETSTISWNSGRLETNRTGGSGYTSYQAISTEIGKRYTVRATIDSTGTGGRQDIRVLSDLSSSGSLLSTSPVNGVSGSTVNVEIYFTAVGTTSYVYTTSDAGGTGFFDNISVKIESWLDQSGKGNDGVVSGAAHNAAGYWEFDGTDDMISIDSVPDFENITVEWWGTSDYTSTGYKAPVMKTTNTSWNDGFGFYQQNGVVSWWVNQWNGTGVTETQSTTEAFGWTHWVGTYDGSDVKMYRNSVLEQSVSFTGSMTNPNVSFDIGHSKDNYHWDGNIGEVRIYPRALTEAQIFQNYNATKSKYINEAPYTAPKISSDAIVYDSTRLILNFDFGNRATYDRVENLLPDTIDLVNDWLSGTGIIETSDVASPLGTYDVFKVTTSTTNNNAIVYQSIDTLTSSTKQYTFSFWAKSVDGSSGTWGVNYFANGHNRTTVPITGEWTRVSFTFTAGSGGENIYIGDNRDGLASINEAYVWGPQLNETSTLSRFVRTYGSSITAPTKVNNLCGLPEYGTPGPGTISGPVWNPDGYFEFGQSTTSGITGPFDYSDTTYQDITVEAWVWGNNWNVNGNAYNGILNRSDGTNHIFSTYILSSGEMGGWWFDINGNIINPTSSTDGDPALVLSTGQWNHCVWVYNDGAGMEFYLNNSAASMYSNSNLREKDNSNQTFTIGRWNGNQYELDGRIGELRFYNRKLFTSEISQNYNATKGKYGL